MLFSVMMIRVKPFKEPILCEAHSTVLARISFVQTLLRHPGHIFDDQMLSTGEVSSNYLPPHVRTVRLQELLGVVAEVLHHVLLPELLHLPAHHCAIKLLQLPARSINISNKMLSWQALRNDIFFLQ